MEGGMLSLSDAARSADPGRTSTGELEQFVDTRSLQALPAFTVASHRAALQRVQAGELDVEAVRVAFEHLVRDGVQVREELASTKTTVLERMGDPRWKGLKKADLVDRVYGGMLDGYGILADAEAGCITTAARTLEERVAFLRRRLKALTPELLVKHRQRVEAQTLRQQTLYQQYHKALATPETREEFELFMRLRGESELSSAQRAARDALMIAGVIQRKSERACETASVQPSTGKTRNAEAARRLRAIGERLEASARSRLSQDRLANTARRARMASSAQDAARTDLALAGTMLNLAAALERGDAVHLQGLREKAQVEQLISLIHVARHKEAEASGLPYREREALRDAPATQKTLEYLTFPAFRADAGDLHTVWSALQGVRGTAQLAGKIEDLMERATAMQGPLPVKTALVEACLEKLGDAAQKAVPWYWLDARARLKRLSRMGIDTPEQLLMACREFLQYREARQAADRALELERALIGSKVGIDFFPTPQALARHMVGLANLQPVDRVLEPSAGNGNIAMAVRQAGVEPDVVEISSQLRGILHAKGFNLVGWDFMDVREGGYNAVVMNPPFSSNADIAHVRHAYSLLRDGGRLVSIVGEGAFNRRGKTEAAFREWLDDIGAEVAALPPGTFTDRELMATTGANARLVVIRK